MTLKPIDIIDLRVTRRQARLLRAVVGYRLETLADTIDPLFDRHDLQTVFEQLEDRMGKGLQPDEMAFVELYGVMTDLGRPAYPNDEED